MSKVSRLEAQDTARRLSKAEGQAVGRLSALLVSDNEGQIGGDRYP